MKNKLKNGLSSIFKNKNKKIKEINPFIQKMKDLLEEEFESSRTRGRYTPGIMQKEFDIEIDNLLREIEESEDRVELRDKVKIKKRLEVIDELLVVLKKDRQLSEASDPLNNTERLICNSVRREQLYDRLEKLSQTSRSWVALRTVSKEFFTLTSDKQWTINFNGLNKYIGNEILQHLPFSQKFLDRMAGVRVDSPRLTLLFPIEIEQKSTRKEKAR